MGVEEKADHTGSVSEAVVRSSRKEGYLKKSTGGSANSPR